MEIAEEVEDKRICLFLVLKLIKFIILKKKFKMKLNDYIGRPLKRVFNIIDTGMFEGKEYLIQLINTIRNNNDTYLVSHDFYSYIEAK